MKEFFVTGENTLKGGEDAQNSEVLDGQKKARSMVYSTIKSVSYLDLLLPFTILLCMIVSILISVYVPSSRHTFDAENHASLVNVSIPLAIGMIVMMIPPICKVSWESIHKYLKEKYVWRQLLLSLILNWIFGPLLMTALAWLALFEHKEYREGIIMIGIARCIAMVLIWNQIAGGDNDLCVVLVVCNSVLQMVLYAPLQLLYCYVISNDHFQGSYNAMFSEVAKSVSAFLGIPLCCGILIRLIFVYSIGKHNYEKHILKYISPWAMIGFHYTICILFVSRGYQFIHEIGSAFLCFIPLVLYFILAWSFTFVLMRYLTNTKPSDDEKCECDQEQLLLKKSWGKKTCSSNYPITMTQCFTTASNNFELSLAVAISIYGNDSQQAIAATFGPLLEVPILMILAIFARYLRIRFIWRTDVPLKAES